MRFRILLAALLVAGVAHADAVEDIARLNHELSVATWTGDAVWFEENLADDYVLITPNGEKQTKRDVVRGLVRPGLKMEPYDTSEAQVRIYGETAIVTGRMQQSFSIGRTRYKNDLRYTHVYVKRRGRWVMASAHTSVVKGL
ncbi:MAG TPA: nuclear transport factor 2 family protein [Thermoanaerobaculia bacterium]|nr:nuclear transport factor 2 family protein [Thermoanaerobaculia bacterium]